MMKKSIVALLLCLTLLLSCGLLASCGSRNPAVPGSDNSAGTTAAAGGTEEEKVKPQRAIINCKGEVFTILGQSNASNGWTGIPDDLYMEEDTGGVLESAVYARNKRIESAFNVQIYADVQNRPDNLIATNAQSGDDKYGLLILRASGLNAFVENGYAYDLKALGLDTNVPWFDQYVCKTLTIKNKLYCVESDLTYMDKPATVAFFFNKEMAKNYRIPDLYDLVVSGEWTFEKMLEYGNLVSQDADNDGQWGLKDVYGASGQNDSTYFMIHSMGAAFATIDNNGDIQCNLFDELFQDRLQRVYDIMLDSTMFINRQTKATKMSAEEVAANFSQGQALFLMRPLQSMYDLRKYQMSFGIIPSPKENKDQEKYYSSVNFYAAGMTMIPSTVQDTERTLAIMEYLAADSHDTVVPVFYNVVLDARLSPDNSATKCLDTIFSNRVFDIGLIWNFGDFRGTIVCKGLENVSAVIASLREPIETGIKNMDERFKD